MVDAKVVLKLWAIYFDEIRLFGPYFISEESFKSRTVFTINYYAWMFVLCI